MFGGRGFATAVIFILIALTCVAIAKRLEGERRLLRKLRESGTVRLDSLSAAERDVAESLRAAGVLRVDRQRGYVQSEALKTFRRKRVRFALSGALVALFLALTVAVVLLR
ncbi:MAG: hypothetical protein IRZ28_01800 [Steroidobacteraceae bacterium]|nr:hypothetical protein [Steroidobacteraceae bacterium]